MTFHHRSFVFDAHCDTIAYALPGWYFRDLREWGQTGHLDLPRWRAAGINCQVFACFPGESRLNSAPSEAALQRLEAFYDLAEQTSGRLTPVLTASDLDALTIDGPIGAILGLEGAEALTDSIGRLHTFFRLGVRLLGLAWDWRNLACDGVMVGSDFGLTPFGRDVVAACNRLGIMIDVSHLNSAGLADVLALTRKPIIASHSNAHALCEHPRNLTDAQLRAIAATGGVIGVTFVHTYLTRPRELASLSHVLDHIDHMVRVVGIDHVGIGSDYDGCITPDDLDSGEKYPRITDGLLARGYAEDAIAKIIGGNFRRVFAQVLPKADDGR